MRHFSPAALPRVRAGWVLPLALLALPNCAQIIGLEPWQPSSTTPGTSVIFCEIPQSPGRRCATDSDKQMGVRIEEAATALASGQSGTVGLDYSATSLANCSGEPEAVLFQGKFPDGYPGCVDCATIGSVATPTADSFCVTTCQDLTDNNTSLCATAKVATNFSPEGSACYADACGGEGTFNADTFVDPRRTPETVAWKNLVGVSANGGTLTRDTPDVNQFDAGAESDDPQIITHGNGYVEFTASGPQAARLAGLSEGPADGNPTYANISFGLDLFTDGCLYVFEGGNKAAGTVQTCSQPDAVDAYMNGQTFRVKVTDNLDGTGKFAPMGGTATVTYTRLNASCMDGTVCSEATLWTSTNTAHYPLRVDSSFREQFGTLENVRLVRIK